MAKAERKHGVPVTQGRFDRLTGGKAALRPPGNASSQLSYHRRSEGLPAPRAPTARRGPAVPTAPRWIVNRRAGMPVDGTSASEPAAYPSRPAPIPRARGSTGWRPVVAQWPVSVEGGRTGRATSAVASAAPSTTIRLLGPSGRGLSADQGRLLPGGGRTACRRPPVPRRRSTCSSRRWRRTHASAAFADRRSWTGRRVLCGLVASHRDWIRTLFRELLTRLPHARLCPGGVR